MKKLFSTIGIGLIFLLLVGLAYEPIIGMGKLIMFIGYIIFAPKEEMCGLQVSQDILSPSGKTKAVLYQFDCGATTPFTTNVSILPPEESVKYAPGNVFAAYGGSKRGDWQGPYTEIKWADQNTLEIIYINDALVTHKSISFDEVNIKYNTIGNVSPAN